MIIKVRRQASVFNYGYFQNNYSVKKACFLINGNDNVLKALNYACIWNEGVHLYVYVILKHGWRYQDVSI